MYIVVNLLLSRAFELSRCRSYIIKHVNVIISCEFQLVTLDFTFFQTESCCDFVYVYDGDSTKSPLMQTLNGKIDPPPSRIISTQRSLFIRFTSDPTDTDVGFSATFTTSASGRQLIASNCNDHCIELTYSVAHMNISDRTINFGRPAATLVIFHVAMSVWHSSEISTAGNRGKIGSIL